MTIGLIRREIRVAFVTTAVLTLGACGGGSTPSGTTASPGSNSTPAAKAGKVAPANVTDLCALYPLSEASALVGASLMNQPQGSSPAHRICFYVRADGRLQAPRVELHLYDAGAGKAVEAVTIGKSAGDRAIAGLGKVAFGGSTGVVVAVDDRYYLTVSVQTSDAPDWEAPSTQVARLLLQRLAI